jgi:hypothetical protein
MRGKPMNKIIRIGIVFVIVLLSVSVLTQSIMAQSENQEVENSTPTGTSVSEELEYTLPYPGILLDHPLYVVKTFRDSIMRMFMNNPVKQIEFSLLQSDKFLSMALVFADAGKWDRAGQAVLLSQKDMEQALKEVTTARGSGVQVPSHIVTNLERSTIKHKQRIDEMKINAKEVTNGLFGKASDAFTLLATQASALREQ